MEKNETLELIDAYLDGALSADQKEAVERRLAEDPAFGQRLRLQWELRGAFGDPGRRRLRASLAKIVQEPLPDDEPTLATGRTISRGWKGAALLIALLAAGWAIWQWRQPADNQPGAPAPQETPGTGPQNTAPELPGGQDTAPPDSKTRTREPIAALDPAFARTRAMDANIGSVRATGDVRLTLSSPALDASFVPDAGGNVAVPFAGELSGKEDEATVELVLLLFDNKGSSRSLAEAPLDLKKTVINLHRFELIQRWRLKPGLYYFMVETADGDMLGGGRFVVVE